MRMMGSGPPRVLLRRISQNIYFQVRVVAQSLAQGLYEFKFRLSNVQSRKIDTFLRLSDFLLQEKKEKKN